ncbi:hypothetical protein Bca52824_050130 [Brassica carinata]|uniref:Uncharacterized protein n=1 Tax=Brassica carinata TaxID=52824 RepID=A0A8X7UVX1_BRACI|nr:hypothetical protein Bca52824_050130 [Brassica carinata]
MEILRSPSDNKTGGAGTHPSRVFTALERRDGDFRAAAAAAVMKEKGRRKRRRTIMLIIVIFR